MTTPNVVMVGLGYIGLPTAALISSKNIPVLGIDINEKVISTINKGEIHIVEPDLDGLVHHVVSKGYLKASLTPEKANVYLIAVPTPFKGDHEPDISHVESAIKMILPTLTDGSLVIIESTSPVGTTEKMQKVIYNERPELKGKIYMAYCPERVLPGNVIHELEHNDRAIGGINEASTEKAIDFYRLFVRGELHKTNARTAEMCKLVENSSRDVQIAFANELSMICDKANINVWELIHLANKHPRVNILQPGTGVGGHCIAVDPWFIVSEFPKEAKIIRDAREINNYKTDWVIEKIKNKVLAYKIEKDKDAKVACMGLAFKPNIDDLRESPALKVTQALYDSGVNIKVVEPNIETHDDFELLSVDEAMKECDIIVFLVAHKEFTYVSNSKENRIMDFCGIFKS
jgi:UDP-N-acetyl-D-mannosaminuronic acid dehydrogenase